MTVSTADVSIDVRPAATDEMATVVDQWLALVDEQHSYGESLESEPNRLAAQEQLGTAIARGDLFVAVTAEETICGFVNCGVEHGRFESRIVRGRIQALYVAPEYRNEGIGSQLLDTAETHLLDRGCEVVLVDVLAANESARTLYANRGYSPHRLTLERRPEVETTTNTNPKG